MRGQWKGELHARTIEGDRREEINNLGGKKKIWKKGEDIRNGMQNQKVLSLCSSMDTLLVIKTVQPLVKLVKSARRQGHFAVVCKTQSSNRDTEQRGKGLKVKQVSTEEERKAKDDYDDDEYAFTIGSKQSQGSASVVDLVVGGVVVKDVLIDSGASCNVVDKQTWEGLKKQGIKCDSRKEIRKLLYIHMVQRHHSTLLACSSLKFGVIVKKLKLNSLLSQEEDELF